MEGGATASTPGAHVQESIGCFHRMFGGRFLRGRHDFIVLAPYTWGPLLCISLRLRVREEFNSNSRYIGGMRTGTGQKSLPIAMCSKRYVI